MISWSVEAARATVDTQQTQLLEHISDLKFLQIAFLLLRPPHAQVTYLCDKQEACPYFGGWTHSPWKHTNMQQDIHLDIPWHINAWPLSSFMIPLHLHDVGIIIFLQLMDNYKLATFNKEPHQTEVLSEGSISKSFVQPLSFYLGWPHFWALGSEYTECGVWRTISADTTSITHERIFISSTLTAPFHNGVST